MERLVLQERLRQGIEGVHFHSLKEHLDEHMVKQVLGEMLRRAGPSLQGPAPDLDALTSVILSRCADLACCSAANEAYPCQGMCSDGNDLKSIETNSTGFKGFPVPIWGPVLQRQVVDFTPDRPKSYFASWQKQAPHHAQRINLAVSFQLLMCWQIWGPVS